MFQKGTLKSDIANAKQIAGGGTEGKNLIELQKEFNNSMIKLAQAFDKWADKIAPYITPLLKDPMKDYQKQVGK